MKRYVKWAILACLSLVMALSACQMEKSGEMLEQPSAFSGEGSSGPEEGILQSEEGQSVVIGEVVDGEIIFDSNLSFSFFSELIESLWDSTGNTATLNSVEIADNPEDPLSEPFLIFVITVKVGDVDSTYTFGTELSREENENGISYILSGGASGYNFKCEAEGSCDGCIPLPNDRKPTSCDCEGGSPDNPADKCSFQMWTNRNNAWLGGLAGAIGGITVAIIVALTGN